MKLKSYCKKIIAIMLLFCLVLSFTAFADDLSEIKEKTEGVLLGDLDSGTIIYEYNIDKPLALASISKLMTYAILMDNIKDGTIKLEDDVTVSYNASHTYGSRFGLREGEKLKVSTLINALLIVSGNDVAISLAEHISGSEESFVHKMNEKAKELGLETAVFINPNGLPDDDNTPDQNYMSIRDLYKFVRYILKTYPEIIEVTKQTELVIPERNFSKKSTNPLFGVVDGVDGLKTGYTDKAGICLVSTLPIEKKDNNSKNFRVISIVMGCTNHDDRLYSSKLLLDYARDNYIYQNVTHKNIKLDEINISNAKKTKVDVYPAEDFSYFCKSGSTISCEIKYNDSIDFPIKKGDKVGLIKCFDGEKNIKNIDVIVHEKVEKANFFVRIFRFFKNLFTK